MRPALQNDAKLPEAKALRGALLTDDLVRPRRSQRSGRWYTKKLLEHLQCGQWVCILDSMANCAFGREDFVVVATLEGLVAEEVDLIKIFLCQVPQTVCL